MRPIHYALAFALVSPLAAPALAEDADNPSPEDAKLAIAREIVDRGFPIENRDQIFFSTMDEMMVQMRAAVEGQLPDDPGAKNILDQWLAEWSDHAKSILKGHIPTLMDAQAQGYASMFTADELRDILAFVSTPSGQRFVELGPAVMATPAFAQANQAYMTEITAALPDAQTELTERLIEYFAEQQEQSQQVES